MLLCTNEVFLACSMSKDGSEGAVFGMWHWRVGGHIHPPVNSTTESFSLFHQRNCSISCLTVSITRLAAKFNIRIFPLSIGCQHVPSDSTYGKDCIVLNLYAVTTPTRAETKVCGSRGTARLASMSLCPSWPSPSSRRSWMETPTRYAAFFEDGRGWIVAKSSVKLSTDTFLPKYSDLTWVMVLLSAPTAPLASP